MNNHHALVVTLLAVAGSSMASEALRDLLRWEGAGGTWRLVKVPSPAVEVALLSCNGGEEMARLRGDAEDFRTYVSSAQPDQ